MAPARLLVEAVAGGAEVAPVVDVQACTNSFQVLPSGVRNAAGAPLLCGEQVAAVVQSGKLGGHGRPCGAHRHAQAEHGGDGEPRQPGLACIRHGHLPP